MPELVECVPNFSEGRDKRKLHAIIEAMKMPGVYVLDLHMDADHNRSVVTLAGARELLVESVLRAVGKAAEVIDLNQHHGTHPRIGATDVVPFVPIESVTLNDCVQMARLVGAEIWHRYGIPVYLYESAALRPERVHLEDIRRGGFERLRQEIETRPERLPDFGDPRLHPTAGATVVGARKFLVAYNIYLNTTDIDVAKKIAGAVRFSSGGLPFVKALGMLVRGRAQVSMNLTDTDQTSIAQVFEFVKRAAAEHGISVLASEIVGLVPGRALREADATLLQIERFDSSFILENRLAAVMEGKAVLGGP